MLAHDGPQQRLLATFADEAAGHLQTINERLVRLESAGGDGRGPLLEEIFRGAHSLKGAARAVGLGHVEAAAHQLESLFSAMQEGAADTEVFDLAHKTLDVLTAVIPLQSAICTPHSLPVSTIFDPLPELVRDLAHELSKQVELTIEGGEIEVETHVLDQLRSPLIHMVRNCVDHGIEHAERREAAGKKREGTLVLTASRRAADLLIEVVDDGAGIDVERVKSKAVERGLMTAENAEAMSEPEALALIFRSGFSTRQEITHVSGRGVGMDVVRHHIERMHGTIDVESTVGKGTKFTLRVPLGTAAIA